VRRRAVRKVFRVAAGCGSAGENGLLIGRQVPIEEASTCAGDEPIVIASRAHGTLGKDALIVAETHAQMGRSTISKRRSVLLGDCTIESHDINEQANRCRLRGIMTSLLSPSFDRLELRGERPALAAVGRHLDLADAAFARPGQARDLIEAGSLHRQKNSNSLRSQRSPIIYGAPLDGRSRARLSRCDAGEGSTSWVSVSFTESSIRLVTAVATVTTETAATVKPAGQGSEALIARTER
jgi:hypothetical protein